MSEIDKYYRLPTCADHWIHCASPVGTPGFFQLGADAICYGVSEAGSTLDVSQSQAFDATAKLETRDFAVHLPFDFDAIVDNLRREKYVDCLLPKRERIVTREWVRDLYYFVRQLLPVPIRRQLQRLYFSDWKARPFPRWPVDFSVDALHREVLRLAMRAAGVSRLPFIWFWPEDARSCLIMTHDVETAAGRDFTHDLMTIDEAYGLSASFQVIPEGRYEISDDYVNGIRRRGFECNIHDLNHDGKLYQERNEFREKAAKINEYARRYNAYGFRAGAMYRNLDWYDAFEFSYDMSVPNVAHLEPKRGGCCTVFPFFIGNVVELPVTMAQDYSIFHILGDYSLTLWSEQLDLIQSNNGLMSFITHPDYLNSRKPQRVYEQLLELLRQKIASDKIWAALPGEVDHWWRARSQMKLVERAGQWVIEGPEQERARIAFAVIEGDRLLYEVPVMVGCT